jgi:hypothetical protein
LHAGTLGADELRTAGVFVPERGMPEASGTSLVATSGAASAAGLAADASSVSVSVSTGTLTAGAVGIDAAMADGAMVGAAGAMVEVAVASRWMDESASSKAAWKES